MTLFKPTYLDLNEFSADNIQSIEYYLNAIELDEYPIDDLTRLTPILIDIFSVTYQNVAPDERNPDVFRVNTTAIALLTETLNILEKAKDEIQLTSLRSYGSTLKNLGKLKRVLDTLQGRTEKLDIVKNLTSEEVEYIVNLRDI
ncbi:MAG: hypothetical protein ACRC80_22715 [Waterburya sp.]